MVKSMAVCPKEPHPCDNIEGGSPPYGIDGDVRKRTESRLMISGGQAAGSCLGLLLMVEFLELLKV